MRPVSVCVRSILNTLSAPARSADGRACRVRVCRSLERGAGDYMKISWGHSFVACWAVLAAAAVSTAPVGLPQTNASPVPAATVAPPADRGPSKAFLDTYCVTCHNQRLKTGGLALDALDVTNVAAHAEEWEKVVVKLRAGLMPPSGMPRPEQAVIDEFAASLEAALDRAAAGRSQSGTHRALSSPESRRIPERDPRSAGARHRRDDAGCRPTR